MPVAASQDPFRRRGQTSSTSFLSFIRKGGARMKRRDDPLQAVKAYFDGLAAKDVSHIPWADNATLRTPLNPAGGERALLRARQAILYFFEGILPALGAVTVVRHYDGSPHRRKLHWQTEKPLRLRCLSCRERRNHRAAEPLRFAPCYGLMSAVPTAKRTGGASPK